MNQAKWYGSKTVWTGFASIIAGIGAIATGTVPMYEGMQMIIMGALGIFLRDAIYKAIPDNPTL